MLHEFLTANRQELIRRCRAKSAERFEPVDTPAAFTHGVPLFLQQLVDTLSAEEMPAAQIGRSAALHGAELLHLGYNVDQVVRDYGDLCQSVTALAVEQKFDIATDEFRTLNRCLDDAIADAVTAFAASHQAAIDNRAIDLQQRLVQFTDEQRRLIAIAIQAYGAIKTGNIGLTGATGALLIFALEELRSLADRTVSEIGLLTATAPVTAS